MSAIGTDIAGRPAVSVVIPMRDASATVGRALESLRAQPGCQWEAVVVDDGSTDESAEIVQAIAGQEPRVRLVRREWLGLASARNTGIESSRGRWLVFLDADDWMLPDALARLVEAAAAGTGAAYGGAAWHDDTEKPLGWSFAPSGPSAGIDELLHSARWVPAGQLLARELLGAERFRPDFAGVEDLDLWLRLASRGVRWTAIDGSVCAYRLRRRSMSRDFGRMAAGHRGAVEAGFALAAERGWPGAGVDCSEARRAAVINRAALEYATAEALADPWPDARRAVRVLETHGMGARIEPEQAASAAWWMLPYAACVAPLVWEREGEASCELVRCAMGWWRVLVAKGLAAVDIPERALERLAELAVAPEAVASALADACEAERRVVVLGLGRNAPSVVRALRVRKIECVARDDAATDGSVVLGGARVPLVGRELPFEAEALHVMTVGDDDAFMRRLPGGLRVVRWSEARRGLASGALAWMRAAADGTHRREAAA